MCCIVLDLEWNQPFSMRSMITTPVRLHGEIIQIGAVKLNEQLEIVDTFKVMVKPKHRLTRAHREKQLKMSCQALHNAPPNRT